MAVALTTGGGLLWEAPGVSSLVCAVCVTRGRRRVAQPRLLSCSTHMQDLQEVTQDLHYENFRSERLKRGGRSLPRPCCPRPRPTPRSADGRRHRLVSHLSYHHILLLV